MPRSQTADSGLGSSSQDVPDEHGNGAADPLGFMSEKDKFGLKGFTFMMQSSPDYASCVVGPDPTNMGFDLNSTEYVPLFDIPISC
jgi:CCR4-NOT transcription complex subunit 2